MICLFVIICLRVYLFVYLFVRLFVVVGDTRRKEDRVVQWQKAHVYLFICLLVCLFICLFACLFVYLLLYVVENGNKIE